MAEAFNLSGYRKWLAGLLALGLLGGAGAAQANIHEVVFDRITDRFDGVATLYVFEAGVFTTGVSDGVVTSPSGTEMVLFDAGGGVLVGESDLYDSEVDLLADWPNGTYSVSLDSGAITGTLDYAPGMPNGHIDILHPDDFGTNVEREPVFQLSSLCSNCDSTYVIALAHVSGDYEFFDDAVPENTTSYDFGVTLDPDTIHIFNALAILSSSAAANFSSDFFTYQQLGTEANEIEFTTVPEPGVFSGLCVGMLALAWLRPRE